MRRITYLVTALALSLFATSSAYAEPAPNGETAAAAEALYNQGIEHLRAERFDEACPLLEESQKLDPGSGTLLAIAVCYEKTGRTASAWAAYLEAQRAARAAGRADRVEAAKRGAAATKPKVAYLTIAVPEGVEISEVRRDGRVVGKRTWGVGIPVDAGTHEIVAKAPGYAPFHTTVTIADTDKREILLGPLEPLAAEAPASVPTEAGPAGDGAGSGANDDGSWSTQKTLAVVAGGVGIVGAGVATVFGLRAKSKLDESNDGPCREGNLCTPHGLELRSEALDNATFSTIGAAVGAVGLGAGLALWFTAPSPGGDTALRITPLISPKSGGVLVRGAL